MAFSDVTVDTNVLMHAADPREALREDAKTFLDRVKASDAKLCVDEGFSPIEANNRSQIGSEYLSKLPVGSIGHGLIAELAKFGRLAFISRSVPQGIASKINQAVKDKSDRVFARVAHNSTDKTLVSHDFAAFSKSTRKTSREEFKIRIIEASAAAALAL
jgi:predicted nucleic acid-binding protein